MAVTESASFPPPGPPVTVAPSQIEALQQRRSRLALDFGDEAAERDYQYRLAALRAEQRSVADQVIEAWRALNPEATCTDRVARILMDLEGRVLGLDSEARE
jgi:hypothetical protein